VQAGPPGWVTGRLTGAAALVEALKTECVDWVFGISCAPDNVLWIEMRKRCLGYLLVIQEYSATVMADGYARSTGRPGVVCVVPGPGVINALTGLGEALLDSVPVVAIVGDIACGSPVQPHARRTEDLLKPVCKAVIQVVNVCQIVGAVREAFALAVKGEPGPIAVVVPCNLLVDIGHFHCPPPAPREAPFDLAAFEAALDLLQARQGSRVGICAGLGCMDYSHALTEVAELLQAPVATSVSGKGTINECHPLAVGWGFGTQGTRAAEQAFKCVDLVLAIGVKFSEVSTAFYANPQPRRLIQVDANPDNLGQILRADVCVHADAGVFLDRLLGHADELRRPPDTALVEMIKACSIEDKKEYAKDYARCGVDPVQFLLALRQATCPDALVFVDVTMTEHWAAEAFTVTKPRTYFNPVDNQAMGWSIPAAIGAQRAHPGRLCVTITGDGCFLMSPLEMVTAVRECLPVKFFILDDQAYHYMQVLQKSAYHRTTATFLAHLDYAALAKAYGLGCVDICSCDQLDGGIHTALEMPGPVLIRVAVDYGKRPCRWISTAKKRYIKELSGDQKLRFVARVGARALDFCPDND
jgi:acetolactate synthase-1/2/3 large subunit